MQPQIAVAFRKHSSQHVGHSARGQVLAIFVVSERGDRHKISGRHGSDGRRISDKSFYLQYEASTKDASRR